MSQKAANAYYADTSGSQRRPIVGSFVEPHNRVTYLTHENLSKGLLGPGLNPTLARFERNLDEAISNLKISHGHEWQSFPSFLMLFEDMLGTTILQAIFRQTLFDQNPNFVRIFWGFDKKVMSLAKRAPWFWIPGAYRLCETHVFAREQSNESGENSEEEFGPLWGSQMVKERQRMLSSVQNQDPKSIASTDFGLLWA